MTQALRIRDVAKLLNCSTKQVHRMIDDGRLPAINVAARPGETRASWRIPEKGLLALLEHRAI